MRNTTIVLGRTSSGKTNNITNLIKQAINTNMIDQVVYPKWEDGLGLIWCVQDELSVRFRPLNPIKENCKCDEYPDLADLMEETCFNTNPSRLAIVFDTIHLCDDSCKSAVKDLPRIMSSIRVKYGNNIKIVVSANLHRKEVPNLTKELLSSTDSLIILTGKN